MSLTIHGLGAALPPHRLAQGDAAMVATRHVVLDDLMGTNGGPVQSFFGSTSPGTGERMRRYTQEAPPLALRAVLAALEQAQVPPERITHLITVSCTGFQAPCVDLALMAALPLRPGVARTHEGFMGCHAAQVATGEGAATSMSPAPSLDWDD